MSYRQASWNGEEFASLFAGLLFGGTFGFLIGVWFTYKDINPTAVKAGHAEYYLDAEHNKQFRWKTNCVQIKEKP